MTASTGYPRRLIEADLFIKRISDHARSERNVKKGAISSLHIWWARRPLASCRAVIVAALLPDPADPGCPDVFRREAAAQMRRLRDLRGGKPQNWDDPLSLRKALLDFIADFAAWELQDNRDYIAACRALIQCAHEALGNGPSARPLVVDPFAGGGAIPFEALHVGADVYASDLNPVPVLINKVLLEYIPRFGLELAEQYRKWADWLLADSRKKLAEFYHVDGDGDTPIAYLWARTIPCLGPSCKTVIPMINQPWIKKKGNPTYAFQFKEASHHDLLCEIVENPTVARVPSGTARQGSVTCPRCGYTIPAENVRAKGRDHGLGTRLLGVVLAIPGTTARRFRSPNQRDLAAIKRAARALDDLQGTSLLPRLLKVQIPITELRRISVPLYGLDTFDKLFLPRQVLALSSLEVSLKDAQKRMEREIRDQSLRKAVVETLALTVSSILHYNMNLSTYLSNGMVSAFIQGTSLAMRSDFAEANPLMPKLVGGLEYSIEQITYLIERVAGPRPGLATVENHSATSVGLPDDAATLIVTDPPYYDSIPYSHLSDIFYIWLRASLGTSYPAMFSGEVTSKEDEIVEDRAHSQSPSVKRADFFEREMTRALAEARRIIGKDQLMVVVFAHKSTRGWEAMLNGLLQAKWTVTSSWPIDTERPARMNAYQNASLLSSIHVVCRPRETEDIGDWRDVLAELPIRIHEWMPRLAEEGVVGADAIFACLGPALEIFSRYSRVEKASGEPVLLKEYLEQVWAAVAKEALSVIFTGADASGFEEDARLTAMWLWTLNAGASSGTNGKGGEEEEGDEETEEEGKKSKTTGFALEYDAARKIAQGLGAHLEELGAVVEMKGDTARLLSVSERAKSLFGQDGEAEAVGGKRRGKKKEKDKGQMTLFTELEEAEEKGLWGERGAPAGGKTVLDRVHQAMILFAAGRGEALRRFLVEEGAGKDGRFWRLAQAFSALYPTGSDEKRWVDGVLARKKGLGL